MKQLLQAPAAGTLLDGFNIDVPIRGWKPRPHQDKLWNYLGRGGKRAVAVPSVPAGRRAAEATGELKLSPLVWEVALPDGSVVAYPERRGRELQL